MKQLIYTAAVIALLFFFIALVPAGSTHAQSAPVFWASWRANSYTPDAFKGKVLPSASSQIAVSFNLIQNGKALGISSDPVRWSVNGKLIKTGNGLREITFTADPQTVAQVVRIEISGVTGRGIKTLSKTISIPTAQPEIVIANPAGKTITAGSVISVEALPYFFNNILLNELRFSWLVNNKAPEGETDNPEMLEITVPENALPGSAISINASVSRQNKTVSESLIINTQ